MRLFCRLGVHSRDHCKCKSCGLRRDADHRWMGCKCAVCGKTRDEGHVWNGCKCKVCGQTRNEGHAWNGCRCKVFRQIRGDMAGQYIEAFITGMKSLGYEADDMIQILKEHL